MSRFAFVMTLTFIRAPLALAAAACALANLARPSWAWVGTSLALLAVSALTDLFDGKLARRWGVTSRLGALADPLMDKLFYVATLPTAVYVAVRLGDTGHALLLLALDVVSMTRDLWVTFLRAATAGTSAKMGAGLAGKIRTALALPVLSLVHFALGVRCLEAHGLADWGVPAWLLYGAEGCLFAVTLVSGLSYTRYYLPFVSNLQNDSSPCP